MAIWVYIIRCCDGTFYTGSTNDLQRRWAQHKRGEGGDYTMRRMPLRLAFAQEFSEAYDAVCAERQIKAWSQDKKKALIAGRFDLLPMLSRNRKRVSADDPSTSSG